MGGGRFAPLSKPTTSISTPVGRAYVGGGFFHGQEAISSADAELNHGNLRNAKSVRFLRRGLQSIAEGRPVVQVERHPRLDGDIWQTTQGRLDKQRGIRQNSYHLTVGKHGSLTLLGAASTADGPPGSRCCRSFLRVAHS